MVLADFMVAFNGGGFLSTDQKVRFEIGWAYTGVLTLSLAVAYVVMVLLTLKSIKQKLHQKVTRKSKQQIKMLKRKQTARRRQTLRMDLLKKQSMGRFSVVVVND